MAQLTTRAVNGEYVVSASLYNTFDPPQLGGTLMFTPPEVCAACASGSVAIGVVYTPAAGDRARTFRTVVPYRLDNGVVLIGDGLAIAGVSGVAAGVVTTMPVILGHAQAGLVEALAGTFVRRTIEATGAPGNREHRVQSGPQARRAKPVLRDCPAEGPPGRRVPQVQQAQPGSLSSAFGSAYATA